LPGINGTQGVSGIPGKNGNPGAKGAAGAAGPIGTKGAAGMKGVKGALGNVAHIEGGAVYVRWGRKSCGSPSTLLYAGELDYYYFVSLTPCSHIVCKNQPYLQMSEVPVQCYETDQALLDSN